MSMSTELDILTALREVTTHGARRWSDAPMASLGLRPAGNDGTGEFPSIFEAHAESAAWHTFAASAFGDIATIDMASSARPTSDEMYHAAHAHPSFTLGEIIVAMTQAAGAIARRAYARHRRRRQATATYDVLCQLDDRMLRDLGFDRSEIRSVVWEVTGEAAYTRVRDLQTLRALPY